MKIYIISLKRALENRIKIKETFQRLNITNYEIIDAIDGNLLEQYNIYKKWRDPWSHLHLTKGEVGCALSHQLVWDKIDQSNDDAGIILEDDFILENEEAFCKIANYQGSVNFDILYLGRKKNGNDDEIEIEESKVNYLELPSSLKIKNAAYSYWCIGYILSKSGVKYLRNLKMDGLLFKDNIFPVDEYIPWAFGKTEIIGLNAVSLPKNTYWTLDPPILKPKNDAFAHSSTFFSQPVPVYNKDIVLLTVGTEENDCVKRYRQSCNRFGYNPIILGLNEEWNGGNMANGPGGGHKINFIKDYLSTIDPSTNQLIVFTDSYDVIANNHVSELIYKYKKYYDNKIVFGTERSCWPNTELANKYPDSPNNLPNKFLNSGNFIAWSNDLKNILTTVIDDNHDDQLYYTHRFLESLQNDNKIVLDYNNHLFVCMNDENRIQVNTSKSCVTINNIRPCFIHGNGPESVKIKLNSVSNYCVAGWNSTYGYKCLNKNDDYPTVLVIYDETPFYNIKTAESILQLDYPENQIRYIWTSDKYHPPPKDSKFEKFSFLKHNGNLFEEVKKIMLENEEYNCDYVFYVNSHSVFTNPKTLQHLVNEKKSIIAPMIRTKKTPFSNFWGDIGGDNFYKRSYDYMDIVNRQKKGCWNVPYVWYSFLIEKAHFNKTSYFTTNLDKGDGVDMAFCYNVRKSNYFMWVLNTEYFGYYYEPITLTSYENDIDEWKKKYLVDNYQESIQDLGDDIIKVKLFTKEFCEEVLKHTNNGKWSKGGNSYYDERIGNTENHPTQDIHLNEIKLESMWKFVCDTFISKIVYNIFKYNTNGINISFIVKYDLKIQKELNPHHDSSAYTVNVCLNNEFEGGGCYFIRKNKTIINKDIGSLIIHPGRVTHYHKGLPITDGERYILVSFVN
jgi:GR25 family glycosyltransferase involved in LPS biosynthesis